MQCPVCQSKKTCTHKTMGIGAIILIVAVGGYFLLRGNYQAPTPASTAPVVPETEETVTSPIQEEATKPSEVKEITVSGTEYSFNPASITTNEGERIKLTFKNTGRVPHNLTIEDLDVATKTIIGGQSDTIEFTAGASGTYSVFCSVPGHKTRGMEGSLEVE